MVSPPLLATGTEIFIESKPVAPQSQPFDTTVYPSSMMNPIPHPQWWLGRRWGLHY